MTGVSIDIIRDKAATSAGDTIMCFVGLDELPADLTFRIEPLGGEFSSVEDGGWPSGDLSPKHARVGERGVELVIGSEIADAAALVPGTPVVISVPGASVREELLWPNLSPAMAAEKGAVIMSAERRRSQFAARSGARHMGIERLASESIGTEHVAADDNFALADLGQVATIRETLARLDMKRKANIKLVATDDAMVTSSLSAALRASADEQPPLPLISDMYASSIDTFDGNAKGQSDVVAELNAMLAHDGIPESKSIPPPLPARFGTQYATRPRVPLPAPPLPPNAPRFLSDSAVHDAGRSAIWRAALIGLVSIVALISAVTVLIWGSSVDLQRWTGAMWTTERVPDAGPTPLTGILAVPEVSTRGVEANGVDLSDALRRADQSLHASGGDKEEAMYWLRRSLALGLGDSRLVWAMTQLGTLYASPQAGVPDYAAARALWELAAAQSDPVAMCFLASLHEHGLGGARDRQSALALYRRSKEKGGCREVDDAIARLSEGAP